MAQLRRTRSSRTSWRNSAQFGAQFADTANAAPLRYAESRELFLKAEVADATAPECEFKWTDPDEAGLLKYLCEEKQFNEERVKSGIERIKKCKGKNSQERLESFFGAPMITSHAKKKEPEKGKGKGKGKAGPSGIKKPGGFKR